MQIVKQWMELFEINNIPTHVWNLKFRITGEVKPYAFKRNQIKPRECPFFAFFAKQLHAKANAQNRATCCRKILNNLSKPSFVKFLHSSIKRSNSRENKSICSIDFVFIAGYF